MSLDSVGQQVREARLAMNLTPQDIQDQLKIRKGYVQAIEDMNLSDLPSKAVAIAMVKQYSSFLGLNEESTLNAFKEAFDIRQPELAKKGLVAVPLPSHLSPRFTIRILPFIASLLVLIYLYYNPLSSASVWVDTQTIPEKFMDILKQSLSEKPPADEDQMSIQKTLKVASNPPPRVTPLLTPVPVETAQALRPIADHPPMPIMVNNLPVEISEVFPPVPVASAFTPFGEDFTPSSSGDETLPEDGLTTAINSDANVINNNSNANTNTPSVDVVQTTEPTSIPEPTGRVYGDETSAYFLQAETGDSWVEIRDKRKRVIFSKILRKGERYAIPSIEGLTLKLGYARGVKVYKDGQQVELYDKNKTVVSNIKLMP